MIHIEQIILTQLDPTSVIISNKGKLDFLNVNTYYINAQTEHIHCKLNLPKVY